MTHQLLLRHCLNIVHTMSIMYPYECPQYHHGMVRATRIRRRCPCEWIRVLVLPAAVDSACGQDNRERHGIKGREAMSIFRQYGVIGYIDRH